jgi:hypothetical protein
VALLESTSLPDGTIDLTAQELVMLDAVLLAEAKSQANWSCLAALAENMSEGEARDAFHEAVGAVLLQAAERFAWVSEARTKIVTAQATSRAAQVVDEAAETIVSRIRKWLD